MNITHKEIAERAYEIWDREGRPAGHETEHWFRAEAELREQGRKKSRRSKKSTDPAVLKTTRGEEM